VIIRHARVANGCTGLADLLSVRAEAGLQIQISLVVGSLKRGAASA